MAFLQPTMEVLRQMNNYAASQNMQNAQTQIPRPGQPTSYQMPPTGFTGNFSPRVWDYMNQDIAGFNTQQPIPTNGGLLGGAPVPVPTGGPQQQIPRPLSMPPNTGPYGRQAMVMSGLLQDPSRQQPAPPGLGGGGILGGGRTGFRIPYGGK